MHFDPVSSQESSSAVRSSNVDPDTLIDPDIDDHAFDRGEDIDCEPQRGNRRRAGLPAAAGVREGLPPAFRMRHQRHYVEQLMGDAPIRTVREIALGDIEAPPDDDSNLQALEDSVRRMGVLEPLLVAGQAGRYQVITGAKRFRAARGAGLRSVPCIVHDVDEDTVKTMREAAMHRAAAPPAPASVPAPVEVPETLTLPPAFSEVTQGLQFVSALLPAMTAADGNRFRWTVLADLAGVELLRARTVAAAAEALASAPALTPVQADAVDIVRRSVASLAPEARLRGLRVDLQAPESEYRLPLDPALVGTAVTGLVQSLFALVSEGGATIRVRVTGTTVRPALIVQVSQEAVDLEPGTVRRFFDGEWREHPSGPASALLLAGAARIARAHGGRVDVQPLPSKGCVVTFVVPRPIGTE